MSTIPQLVAAGTVGGSAASTTVTKTTGATTNDIGIIFVFTQAQALPTTTGQTPKYIAATDSGWTKHGSAPYQANGINYYMFWRRLDGSSLDSPATGDSGVMNYWHRVDVRGCVTTGTPFEADGFGQDTSTLTAVTVTGITTLGANRLIVGGAETIVDSTSASFNGAWVNANFAGPGITKVGETSESTGNGLQASTFYGGKALQGATGDTTTTLAGNAPAKSFFRMALKPVPDVVERSAVVGATAAITATNRFTGVAARYFDGADDALQCAIGGVNLTGAYTIAALVRRTSSGPAEYFVANTTSAGGNAAALIANVSDQVAVVQGATARNGTTTLTVNDGWALVAVTKAAGTATPRLHILKTGGSWVHEDASGTLGNPSSQAGGTVRFAEMFGSLTFLSIAAAAEWTSALTDEQIATLSVTSAQAIADLAPQAFWTFDKPVATALEDRTGTSNQSAITGTTKVREGPTGLVYPITFTRTAALAATAAVTSAGQSFSVVERSAALAATGAVGVAPQRDLLRQSAVAATGAVTAAGEVEGVAEEVERSAALDAAADVAAAGTSWTTFGRAAAVEASSAVEAVPQRELLRASALAATGDVTTAGTVVAVHERAAAVAATGEVTAAHQRELQRAVAVAATSAAAAAFERDLLRLASVDATGAVTAAGLAVLARSAAVGATADIATAPQRELQRSVAVAASGDVAAVGHVVPCRAAEVAATAAVEAVPQRELSRQVELTAATDVASAGGVQGIVQGQAALSATTSVAAAPQRDLLRSAEFAAQGAMEGTGVAFSIVERAASVSAAGAVASTHQCELQRAANPAATAAVAAQGVAWSTVERAAALGGVGAVDSSGQCEMFRSAALAGSSGIATQGQVEQPGIITSSAALEAATAVEAAYQRELLRGVAVGALTAVASRPQRELLRATAVSGAAGLAVAGQRELQRQVALTALTAIASGGEQLSGVERAAALAATAAVEIVGTHEAMRAAALAAATGIASSGDVEHVVRAAVLVTAVSAIGSTYEHELTRTALVVALARIAATGTIEKVMPQWPARGTIAHGPAGQALGRQPFTDRVGRQPTTGPPIG